MLLKINPFWLKVKRLEIHWFQLERTDGDYLFGYQLQTLVLLKDFL